MAISVAHLLILHVNDHTPAITFVNMAAWLPCQWVDSHQDFPRNHVEPPFPRQFTSIADFKKAVRVAYLASPYNQSPAPVDELVSTVDELVNTVDFISLDTYHERVGEKMFDLVKDMWVSR